MYSANLNLHISKKALHNDNKKRFEKVDFMDFWIYAIAYCGFMKVNFVDLGE